MDHRENKQMLDPYNQSVLEDCDNVASITECTGLIPTPPVNEEEAEAYTDLYTIPKPAKGGEHGLQEIEKKI